MKNYCEKRISSGVFTLSGLLRWRLTTIILICGIALWVNTEVCFSQDNAGGNQNNSSSNTPQPTTVVSNEFPPSPEFYRGNGSTSRDAGGYINLFSFILVFLLFFAWVYHSRWVDEDSRALKVRPVYWSTAMMSGGLIGVLLSFIIPLPFVGFLLLIGFYGLPLGLYVKERNSHVPERAKVMTPAHLRGVGIRMLAKVGIHVGSQEEQEVAVGPPITFIGKSSTGNNEADRSSQVQKSAGFLSAKELVYDAILRRSTDIHIEPKDDEFAIRIRIDGVMYPTEPFDKPTGFAILNIFKVLSAMDITERRRPQDGSFRAEVEDREVDFRVATQGTRFGEKMSLRILDQTSSTNSLPALGFRKALLKDMGKVIESPHGLFLSCGPTGAGKSTTLYAAISSIDAYQKNIITVEDPVEYKMENVNQIEINSKAGQSFAGALRSILRQDPDVIMIGEIRDGETANIACQAANTGHMVFSTIHANDTITALYRLMELGVEPFMVANSVSCILAQRLARRLCKKCRKAYKPKAEFLKKAGLPANKIKQFYRPPQGANECDECGGLGYKGRVGVFELLSISERMRDLIRDKEAMTAIRAEARKTGMLTMKEEGLRLVIQGLTSVEELMRIVK